MYTVYYWSYIYIWLIIVLTFWERNYQRYSAMFQPGPHRPGQWARVLLPPSNQTDHLVQPPRPPSRAGWRVGPVQAERRGSANLPPALISGTLLLLLILSYCCCEVTPAASCQSSAGWQQLVDKASGRVYYHDPSSGTTSWAPPEPPPAPLPGAPADSPVRLCVRILSGLKWHKTRCHDNNNNQINTNGEQLWL